MGWERLTLVVDGAEAPALVGELEAMGAISVDLGDADAGPDERAIFAEPGAEPGLWRRCRVAALFAEGRAPRLPGAAVERLEDADWVAETQRQFEPVHASPRIWIVPTWREPPDRAAVNVMLDPGAAFGTGSHATTRLCLAWLERHVDPRSTVLDYGCGSGILAIAAMKLGARAATAVDIDPLALEAARYNAELNGVVVRVASADTPIASEPATLTIANILANPLRMLAPVLAAHTAPGGRIALAGILESQAAEVAESYAPWTALAHETREGEWLLLSGIRLGPC